MASVRWQEEPQHAESLAVSLRAILAGRGIDPGYDELVATLGLGALVIAAPDENLDLWPTFGRDPALESTAALYGLRLRDLHPPSAAQGLERAGEFAAHFSDSYVPLIERALQCNQLVLAWCGWPPPRERAWGVITQVRANLVTGFTIRHVGQPMPLCGPALQVYVVEDFVPTETLDARQLFAHSAGLALRAWESTWAGAPTRSGGAAYDAWIDAARDPRSTVRGHVAIAEALVSARQAQCRWLSRIAPELSANLRSIAGAWADVCNTVAEVLRELTIADSTRALLATPQRRQFAADMIASARTAESALYSLPAFRSAADLASLPA